MIKLNELRIGNWVTDAFGNYVKIESIVSEYNVSGYRLETLNPIPLTGGVIGKCGLSKDHTNEYWTFWKLQNGFHITESHHREPSAGVDIGKFYWGDDYIEVKNLHHLTNLYFALTGTELQVTL